jgi:hypothetical protein
MKRSKPSSSAVALLPNAAAYEAYDAGRVLRKIGYEEHEGKLAAKGFNSLEQLQFTTLETLLQSGVPAGHAPRMYAMLKHALGTPPPGPFISSSDGAARKHSPVRVYVICTAPPVIRDINIARMTCNMRMGFDAIWCDPRFAGGSVNSGDPVLAPHCWKPRFKIPGTTIQCGARSLSVFVCGHFDWELPTCRLLLLRK